MTARGGCRRGRCVRRTVHVTVSPGTGRCRGLRCWSGSGPCSPLVTSRLRCLLRQSEVTSSVLGLLVPGVFVAAPLALGYPGRADRGLRPVKRAAVSPEPVLVGLALAVCVYFDTLLMAASANPNSTKSNPAAVASIRSIELPTVSPISTPSRWCVDSKTGGPNRRARPNCATGTVTAGDRVRWSLSRGQITVVRRCQ